MWGSAAKPRPNLMGQKTNVSSQSTHWHLKRPHPIDSGRALFDHFVLDLKQSIASCRNKLYLAYERSLPYLLREKSRRILMTESTDLLKKQIVEGFDRSHHHVQFGPLSPANLGEFDLVVPSSVSELMQARQWPQLLDKNPIPFPSAESVRLCDDKYEFSQALIKRGFGEYIPRTGTNLETPYILKKRIGLFGRESRVILDRSGESEAGDSVNDPAFFRQEIIRGRREFATHILFAKGKIVKSLNILYEFDSQTPIKGQDAWLYVMVHRCQHLDLFAEILRSIQFEGLCCVNYKIAGGRPYIFEINPRFGGSLAPYFFSFIRHLKFGAASR